MPINSLDEIYQHADDLRRVFAFYEREKAEGKSQQPEPKGEGAPEEG